MKEDWIYKRGDLYYANLNPYFGSEQGGTRPVLVLRSFTSTSFGLTHGLRRLLSRSDYGCKRAFLLVMP